VIQLPPIKISYVRFVLRPLVLQIHDRPKLVLLSIRVQDRDCHIKVEVVRDILERTTRLQRKISKFITQLQRTLVNNMYWTALISTGLLGAASGNPIRYPRIKSNGPPLLNSFDALGAWFDGVAAINASSTPSGSNASIAIVGAGISGLATAMMLDSVGVHNWELIEASERVGGRFRTKFVGGTQEFSEMGPMRIPFQATYKSDDSTHTYEEHQLTYQLAKWLNELNGHDPEWQVNFIPWIQHHPNELLARGTGRLPGGRAPTRADIALNASLKAPDPILSAEYSNIKQDMNKILKNESTLQSIQKDPWRAHREAMDQNLDDYSEQSLMRTVFAASENVTDAIWTSTDYDVLWDEMVHNSNLGLDGSSESLGETEWKCIDGGFNRLSDAFIPHISDRLTLNRKITKLEPIEGAEGNLKTRLSWKTGDRTASSKDYDYTIMAVPFTMTRFMELPTFSSVLGRAISEAGLRFKSACKVSVLFSERFWEKGDRPIFGGYSQPESAPIGALYYPVYGLNETGRPGLITHYRGGDWSDRFVSFSDEQHVDMVLDAIASLHGEHVRDLYTGDFERLCWLQDVSVLCRLQCPSSF